MWTQTEAVCSWSTLFFRYTDKTFQQTTKAVNFCCDLRFEGLRGIGHLKPVPMQPCQLHPCIHTQSMEVNEDSDQKLVFSPTG